MTSGWTRKIESKDAPFGRYIAGFRRWLELLNYVPTTIKYGPVRIAEFLEWMRANGVTEIEQITGAKVKEFFVALAKRKNKRTGEVLSLSTLRSYLTTINQFASYIRQSEQCNIAVPVQFKGRSTSKVEVLTRAEIKRLYRVTEDSLLGIRDRAMLAVFYGCGVRRNEGSQLEIRDILPDKNLLYIRKGKGYKERYVPMVGKVKKDILEYVIIARSMMIADATNETLFISLTGKSLKPKSMYERFKVLLRKARIGKKAGLHTLRHSIATHLLMSGMKLSEIAKFLGHSSLESTQIYTHLKDAL